MDKEWSKWQRVRGERMLLPSEQLNTVPKLFLTAVRERGSKAALREKDFGIWQEINWLDYEQHVRWFAMGLRRLGLQRGARVCIQSENNQEWLYADLAIQAAGGITVGVYPTNPAAEAAYIIADCGAEFFVSEDQEHVDKLREVRDRLPFLRYVICMNMKGIRQYGDPSILSFKEVERLGQEVLDEDPGLFEESVAQGQPDDPCVIIYTSGTTGDPKGAVITHRNVLETSRLLLSVLRLQDTDTHMSYLPLCHALERTFSIALHLMAGYVVHFAESIDTVQRDLQEVAPTFFITVPRILEKMQASIKINMDNSSPVKRLVFDQGVQKGHILAEKLLAGERLTARDKLAQTLLKLLLQRPLQHFLGLSRARYVISGGAPLSPEVSRFFHAIGVPVRELFGMTELTTVTTLHRDGDIKIGTLGKVLPGWELKIAADGEMLFRGPGVIRGYWGKPEATREAITPDGWLCTGDLGELDADGHLRIIGRKKDIIITSGGKNVSPQYIENKLKGSPYIREAVVVGDGRKYLGALIQIETDVVGNWAQSQHIPFTTIRDLSHRAEVIHLIRQVVGQVNQELARVEQIKKFCLIDKELYHEEGDLTATQKTRRAILLQKFSDLVEALYREDGGGVEV